MAKRVDQTEEKIHQVEAALSRSEAFIEKNQRILLYIIGAVALIVLGYFAYQRYYLVPRENTAQAQSFMAQKYFEMDSLNLALNGDGQYPGFLSVIDDYGSTKAGKLAQLYAGLIYLNQGKYDEAITHLKKFRLKDEFAYAMAQGAIGDAYMEQNKPAEAASQYLSAAKESENTLTTPLFLQKAAFAYEEQNNLAEAAKIYERIRVEFPKSMEAADVEKHLARINALQGK